MFKGAGTPASNASAMSFLARARTIARTHGVRALAARTSARLRKLLNARIEARARRRAWRALVERVRSGPVYFPRRRAPMVTVAIVATEHGTRLASCLNALLRQLDALPCEVMVVDDAAPDAVRSYLAACSGITVLHHEAALGFGRSAARAVAAARGRFIAFLDQDVIVAPDWLGTLVAACRGDERIAAVGSRLCAPNGRTVHAGGIIWRDGSVSPFGADANTRAHASAFPREIDAFSCASVLLRIDAVRAVGGVPEELADANACALELAMRLHRARYRVLYEPASVAIRFDDASEVRSAPAGFVRRWEEDLARHLPPDDLLIERAARRIAGRRTALVMDSFVPFDDRSAGARRMLAIMRMIRALGWHVIFVAHDGGAYEPYTARARRLGIEVIPHRGDAEAALRALPVPIDVAWIARPDVLSRYLPVLRSAVRAPIVYDTVDLHFVRRRREGDVRGTETHWEAMQSIELDLARKAEVTVVTSESDAVVLAEGGIGAHVVPIVERRADLRVSYGARRDLLFVGNYSHEPNVDAVVRLVREIMPLVWERAPDLGVELAGADPTPAVLRLASERVRVTGYVEHVETLIDRARVFAAPLRYGAGMKGKIVQSIARGLPVVTTAIGAEGIGLADGHSAIVREDALEFADALLAIYNDEELWRRIADGGYDAARTFEDTAVTPLVERALDAALQHVEQVRVHFGFSANAP